MSLSRTHIDQVCKMGQGEATCRYMYLDGTGMHCGKVEPAMQAMLDQRVAAGAMLAVGDNCEGVSDE